MNTPSTDKNIAAWNDQPLDTWHEIVVSLEYARFSVNSNPTGGFGIVFFEDIVDMPREGGPDYSLGYTPSTKINDCKFQGYAGLAAAYLGIGFDRYNNFALETDAVDGIALSAQKPQQSIAIRDSINSKYSLLYNLADEKTIQEIPGLEDYTLDQNVSSIDEVVYRSIRVIINKNFTELTVQVKPQNSKTDFITVFTKTLALKNRTAVKVAITNTTLEGNTQFIVRQFNVAGFPGIIQQGSLLTTCEQIIPQEYHSTGTVLAMGQEYISLPIETELRTYTTNLSRYIFKNNIFSGSGFKILGEDNYNNIVTTYNDSNVVNIVTFLGEKPAITSSLQTFDLAYPSSADINGNILVYCTKPDVLIGNAGGAFIYQFNNTSTDPAVIGTWSLYQTISPGSILSGVGMGTAVGITDTHLAIGNDNQYIHMFKKDATGSYVFKQTITSPAAGTTKFGSVISIEGNDMLVGAPYAGKLQYNNPGQGEVYHYYYSASTQSWNLIMALGSFYNLDTIAGNFGTSIKIRGNKCIIGSPCEAWLEDGAENETVNVGRVYVFNKTNQGLFTQATVLSPSQSIREQYMFFGNAVNIYDKYAAVLVPYNEKYSKSYLCVYDTDCVFPTPPIHIPIPDCAISLMDSSGYVISIVNQTYMLSLSCILENT